MAASVTITNITRDGNGGGTIWFGSKGYAFSSLADFQIYADQLFNDRELLERIALALIFQRIGDLSNPAVLIGHSLTFDPTIINVLRVS